MTHALITIAILILTPLAVRALLAWLRRRFPAPARGPADHGVERLAETYRKMVQWTTLGWLVGAVALAVLLGTLLADAGRARAATVPAAELVFAPNWPLWLLPAFFLSLSAAALLADTVLRLTLDTRYRALMRFDELEHGFTRRAGLWVFAAITAVCLAVCAGLWDFYAVAASDRLHLNGFWTAQERQCRYADLTAIHTAPKYLAGWSVFAREHPRRHYLFEFSDGCRFTTDSAPRGILIEERRRLAAFVAERSGVEIRELPVLVL